MASAGEGGAGGAGEAGGGQASDHNSLWDNH